MKQDKDSEYGLKGILASVFFAAGIWYLALASWPKLRNILPWPHEVGEALVRLLFNSAFWVNFRNTLARVLIAFVLANCGAAPLGFLINRYRLLRSLLVFPLEFLRSLPAVVLLPLILIFLDPGGVLVKKLPV